MKTATITAPLGLTETLRRTPAGESIYLTAASPTISACAASAGIKVTTARLLAIHPGTKAVTDITEVTVVSHPDEDVGVPVAVKFKPPVKSFQPLRRSRTHAV